MAPLTSAVVLAAGSSTRMGSPKALLLFGGRPALAWLLESIARAGVVDAVVVTAGDRAIEEVALGLRARVAVNSSPERGRTGSLLAGLAGIAPDRWLLVAPVDCPLVSAGTIAALLARGADAPLVRPRHGGIGGHPLLMAPGLRAEIAALAPDTPLRDMLRRDPRRVLSLDVDDPDAVANLDTPADHEAAVSRFARRRP